MLTALDKCSGLDFVVVSRPDESLPEGGVLGGLLLCMFHVPSLLRGTKHGEERRDNREKRKPTTANNSKTQQTHCVADNM